MIQNLYNQTIHLFKKIDPLKYFNSFEYVEVTWEELDQSTINIIYCIEDFILKIGGDFYIYSGEKNYAWEEKKPSIIRFQNRNKIIKEIKET